MIAHNSKIIGEGLTYDDVLLIPNYSNVLPREVSIQSKFSRNITLNVPIVSAAMDTVTESAMAIAMAQEGGIGVLHKNMTIEQQAAKVRKVKRAESGMIIDPVTLPMTSTVADAKAAMKEFGKPVQLLRAQIAVEINLPFERDLFLAVKLGFELVGAGQAKPGQAFPAGMFGEAQQPFAVAALADRFAQFGG